MNANGNLKPAQIIRGRLMIEALGKIEDLQLEISPVEIAETMGTVLSSTAGVARAGALSDKSLTLDPSTPAQDHATLALAVACGLGVWFEKTLGFEAIKPFCSAVQRSLSPLTATGWTCIDATLRAPSEKVAQ